MHEVYSETGEKNGRDWFDLQLEEDQLLAMAIANELGEKELDLAFGWVDEAFGSSSNEVSASPVAPHLPAEQRKRARVSLLALEEVDHAHTLAMRMPDRPGMPPLTDGRARTDGRGGISRADRDRRAARTRRVVELHDDGDVGSEREDRVPPRAVAEARGEEAARASGATEGNAGTKEAGGTGMRLARFQALSAPQPVVSPLGPLLPPVIAAMRRITRAVVAGERSCSSPMNP